MAVGSRDHRHRLPARPGGRDALAHRRRRPRRGDLRRGIATGDAAVTGDLGDLGDHQRAHRVPLGLSAGDADVSRPAHRAHPYPAAPRPPARRQRSGPALHLGAVARARFGLESMGLSLAYTTSAVVMAQVFVSLPFMVMSVETATASSGQRFELTAAELGARPNRVFFTITLPLLRQGIMTGAVLCFA